MVAGDYVPERGELVWLSFDPQAGHEQAGRRPAVVVSPRAYNEKSGLALVCPVTRKSKGYPFEVALPEGGEVTGVVLADQVRAVDWRARRAQASSKIPAAVLSELVDKLCLLIAEYP